MLGARFKLMIKWSTMLSKIIEKFLINEHFMELSHFTNSSSSLINERHLSHDKKTATKYQKNNFSWLASLLRVVSYFRFSKEIFFLNIQNKI